MKPILLLILSFFFGSAALNAQQLPLATEYPKKQLDSLLNRYYSQEANDINQPPQTVLNRFQEHFPKAREIDWETYDYFYEADFEQNNVDIVALYDSKGNLLMCLVDITNRDIPDAVKKSVNNRYKGWRIDDAEKMCTAYETQYRIYLEKSGKELKTFFTDRGEFISETPRN